MNNPFEVIEKRLISIENLIFELKQPKQAESAPSEKLLTVPETAEFLNLTVPTIYSKVSKGELPVMKRSKRLYFSRTELMNYLKAGRRKSNADIEAEAASYVTSKNGRAGK